MRKINQHKCFNVYVEVNIKIIKAMNNACNEHSSKPFCTKGFTKITKPNNQTSETPFKQHSRKYLNFARKQLQITDY